MHLYSVQVIIWKPIHKNRLLETGGHSLYFRMGYAEVVQFIGTRSPCSHDLISRILTFNSQICTELASSGRVVLALEHRDGTGPACVDSEGRVKLYTKESEVMYTH
jgi:hypothetical protein